MAFVRGAALLVLALALAGCAMGEAEEADEITAEQLAIMVLPQEAFGAEYGTFAVQEDSGRGTARDLAEGTIDPDDTAAAVKRAGWTSGYDLGYFDSSQTRLAADRRHGALAVGTSADLFATETDARAFILNELNTFRRFEEKKLNGVKLLGFDEFDVSAGDEGWGTEYQLGEGEANIRATMVIFRHGRLVASTYFVRADDTDMRNQATTLAQTLESRIERALAGELDAEPVPVPGQAPEASAAQLSKMTLSLKDLPTGAYLSDESRVESKVSVGFYRTFDVESAMIGGSHLMFLRAGTLVYENAASAQLSMRYVSGPKGRSEFARGVLRDFRKNVGARPRNVRVAPMHRPGAGATGMVITFDLPTGRYRIATVLVRSGRALAVVSGFCTAHAVHPEDISPLGEKALRRLRTVPV